MKTANGLTDSLVFSDKDDKPYAPSHIPSMSISLWNIMNPHSIRKEEGIEFQQKPIRDETCNGPLCAGKQASEYSIC